MNGPTGREAVGRSRAPVLVACLALLLVACEPLPVREIAVEGNPFDVKVPASIRAGSWDDAFYYSRGGILVVQPGSLRFDDRSVGALGGEEGLEFLPVDTERRVLWYDEDTIAPHLVDILRTHAQAAPEKEVEVAAVEEEGDVGSPYRTPCDNPALSPILVLAHPDTPMSTIRTVQVSACLAGARTIGLGFAAGASWPPDDTSRGADFLDGPAVYPLTRLYGADQYAMPPDAGWSTPQNPVTEFSVRLTKNAFHAYDEFGRTEFELELEFADDDTLALESGHGLYEHWRRIMTEPSHMDGVPVSVFVAPSLNLRTWAQLTDVVAYHRGSEGRFLGASFGSVDAFAESEPIEIEQLHPRTGDIETVPLELVHPEIAGILDANWRRSRFLSPSGRPPPE